MDYNANGKQLALKENSSLFNYFLSMKGNWVYYASPVIGTAAAIAFLPGLELLKSNILEVFSTCTGLLTVILTLPEVKKLRVVTPLYFLFFSLTTLSAGYMVITLNEIGSTFGLAYLWLLIFHSAVIDRENNRGQYSFVRLSFVLWMLILSWRLVSDWGDEIYFEYVNHFELIVVCLGITLAIVGVVASNLRDSRILEEKKQQEGTIDWFSTLVNLMSHNLRTPLATILSNAELLQARHPSVYKSSEIDRITDSVESLDRITSRLLKATFVTDKLSESTLEESLRKTYPKLEITGSIISDSYNEAVSLHLALEVFLDNAFRFSPDKVKLELGSSQITLRDYGPGLSEEQLQSFGRLKGNTLGTLHGLGIPFALRVLESIGYGVKATNTYLGLQIELGKGLGFADASMNPADFNKPRVKVS